MLSPSALRASPQFQIQPEVDLQQAINALADFGLVTAQVPDLNAEDPASYTVTLHPLVAEVTRALHEVRASRGEYLALASKGLHDAAARRDPRNPADWPFWHLATAHMHRLLEQAGDGDNGPKAETLTVTAIACIQYATDAGLYGVARAATDQVATVGAMLPSEGRTALRLRFHRVHLTDLAGDFAAAESEYRTLLDIQRRVLRDDDPDTLWTQHALARVRDLRGDLDGAQSDFQAVLEGRYGSLGLITSTPSGRDTIWHGSLASEATSTQRKPSTAPYSTARPIFSARITPTLKAPPGLGDLLRRIGAQPPTRPFADGLGWWGFSGGGS